MRQGGRTSTTVAWHLGVNAKSQGCVSNEALVPLK